MDRVEFIYRLPSMVLMQQEPLAPLRFEAGDWRVTLYEPGRDPALSHRGEWQVSFENPRHRYGDIVRLDIGLPPSLDQDPILTSARLPGLEDVAQDCVRRLAMLLPVETGQFWIGHQPSPMPWFRMALRVSMLKDDGRETYLGTELVEPTLDRRWRLTAETWSRIGEQLAGRREPQLPRVLLHEALGFQFSGNLRLAVLSCAMACEIALKTYIREMHGEREPLYAYIVERDRELSVFDYLNDVLRLATGKRAKDLLDGGEVGGQRIGYVQIERLFQARNRVAHQGRAYYMSGSGKTEYPVTEEVLSAFITSARLLLDWLDALRRGAA